MEQAAREPVLQRFVWFQHLNGDDIRDDCRPGSPWRYRLVYNARYQEQIRRYEVISDGGEGAILVSLVQGRAKLTNLSLSDPLAPWRWKRSETRLDAEGVFQFFAALGASGAFEPAPKGLRLPSAGFYWILVGCQEGAMHFNAWVLPSERGQRLAFPGFLFERDATGVAVNPPREIDASLLTFPRANPQVSNEPATFWLTVGENGLEGF